MERSDSDRGGLSYDVHHPPFPVYRKGGMVHIVGRLASLGGPLLLAGRCLVANPMRSLVGSAGRAQPGRAREGEGGQTEPNFVAKEIPRTIPGNSPEMSAIF